MLSASNGQNEFVVDRSIVWKIKFLPYSVGVHQALLSGEVHDSELAGVAQIDEDVRIVFKWLYL